MSQNNSRATWLHSLVSIIGTAYLYLVGKTTFIRKWDDPAYLAIRRQKLPAIYAFWHNHQVFIAYDHRGEQAGVMVSQSKDGEYIAQVMKWLRLNAVRGSTTRGGEQALRELLDYLSAGKQVAFTPDGPKGPLQTVHGGVVIAAQTSGCPVVCLSAPVSRRVEFKSWDRFVLPLPLSRAVVAHAKPFFISKDLSETQAKEKIRNKLNAITDLAAEQEKKSSGWFRALSGQVLFVLYGFLGLVTIPVWFPILVLKFGLGRAGRSFGDRLGLGFVPAASDKKRIWFHAASVGEWQALRPLLLQLKGESSFEFVITTSTPEAKELIQKEFSDVTTTLIPADLPGIMSHWIKKVDPFAFVLVETEIWPHLMRGLYNRNVPVFVVNGRLSQRSASLWSCVKPFMATILEGVSQFYVRSDEDARHFKSIGADGSRVMVTGNLKIDNLAVTDIQERVNIRQNLFGFRDGVVLIGGSTWDGEEKTLLEIYQKLRTSNLRLILAPRQLSRLGEVEKLLKSHNIAYALWSKSKKAKTWATDVLVVDTLGDLKNMYAAADVAFVGGTLVPHGGQNPLEPAAAGTGVIFGPSMENFAEEAKALVKSGGALQIENALQLEETLIRVLNDPSITHKLGGQAQTLVRSQQGVAGRIKENFLDQLRYGE